MQRGTPQLFFNDKTNYTKENLKELNKQLYIHYLHQTIASPFDLQAQKFTCGTNVQFNIQSKNIKTSVEILEAFL